MSDSAMNGAIAWHGHEGPALDRAGEFTVIECHACRFRHVIPVPTPEELERVYRHDYYATEKPLYLTHVREDLEWWNAVYARRFDGFERLLPPKKGARRVLDVGSGPGFFLLYGKERGWRELGVEPSAQAVEHSRGLGVETIQGFFSEETAERLGRFDVVHLSEVLEHVPDPAAMVRLVHRVLEPGGLVCVTVPNDYNQIQAALRQVCGFQPWWVVPPHHINYFNFDSLRELLSRQFEVVSTEATFPIDMFLLMGDNYVGNDSLGREVHGKRKRFELNLARAGMQDVTRKLYEALAEAQLGRDIVMIGRKPESPRP